MSCAIHVRHLVRLVSAVFLLLAARTPANAAAWFVTGSFGSDANACTASNGSCRTINGAIAKAQAGDAIFVTAAIYTGTGPDAIVHVDKSLTIIGGWDLAFSKTPAGFTILNGEHQRQGLVVDKGADLVVSDVAIIWGFGGDGGGADVEGGLWGERMLIAQNRAFRGGGIYFNARVGNYLTLVHSVLYANEYYVGGGGLFVDGFRHDDPDNPYHVNGAIAPATTTSAVFRGPRDFCATWVPTSGCSTSRDPSRIRGPVPGPWISARRSPGTHVAARGPIGAVSATPC